MAKVISSEISTDDAVHYRVIQDALRKGNAAVMVGAGFSRNATGGENFATWPELDVRKSYDHLM